MSKISHWSNFAVEFTTRLRTPSEFSLGWEFLEVRQNNCHRHIQPTCWCHELTSMLSLRVGLESSRSLFKFCYEDNQKTVWNELLSNGLTLSCWAFAFCLWAPSSCHEKLYPGQRSSTLDRKKTIYLRYWNWELLSRGHFLLTVVRTSKRLCPNGWRQKIYGLCGMGSAKSSNVLQVVRVGRSRPSDKSSKWQDKNL